MKLELSFGSFKDLKEQLQIMLDELGVSNTLPDVEEVHPLRQVSPAMIENPVVARQREFDAKQEAEAPKKRTRRTKAEIEAEKNQPAVEGKSTPEVVEQPVLPTLPEVVEPTALVETAPKNFYSLSEFSVNFAIVLNTLLNDGSLSIGDLETACKYYDVKNIYFISKDIAMMEHYYNDLVARQIITKKGDY